MLCACFAASFERFWSKVPQFLLSSTAFQASRDRLSGHLPIFTSTPFNAAIAARLVALSMAVLQELGGCWEASPRMDHVQ